MPLQRTLLPLLIFLHVLPLSLQLTDKIDAVDLAALASIKSTLTDIPGTDFLSTWDFTSPDPCSTFSGLTCSSNRVTTLTLGTGDSGSPGLAGSLSPSLTNLTELTQLIIFPGLVTGPIPSLLGRLTNLRVISLTHNRFTGPIPPSISSLKSLHTLDLSFNQLTGTIPPGLTSLPELKILILNDNSLSGELPRVSTQLLHLDLKKNNLSGPLRSSSLPSTLRYLSLSANSLWGPLNGLLSLSELVYLDLSMNRFSGPIPAHLFNPTLPSLYLQRNNLSGPLPSSTPLDPTPTSYGPGSVVDLSHNLIVGPLTSILVDVEMLFLNNNRLIGVVPEDYIKSIYLGTTKTLYLQHNYLSKFPLQSGFVLPNTVSLCLSYNCMVPPIGPDVMTCPASAGGQLTRPESQCPVFSHRSATD